MFTELSPVTTGWWGVSPDAPALRWSSSSVPPPPTDHGGGCRLAWNSSALCSRLASAASTSLLHSILQRRQKKHWREASSPVRSQGLEKVLHASSHQFPKCGGSPQKWPLRAEWRPPPVSLACTPASHMALGPWAPAGRRLSTAVCPDTHPPPPLPVPTVGTPRPPHPAGCAGRTDLASPVECSGADLQFHSHTVRQPSSVAGRAWPPGSA